MKVILVNTDFMHDTERPIQPLTMYTIAGIITPYVEEVEVIEPMKYRLFPENGKLVDVLIAKSKKASLIAFTANSFSWAEILKITLAIRENNKQVKIVVGGIHVSYFYREILKENPQISFAFTGEAEKSFPQLIKYLNGEIPIENVPNLHYMRNGRLVLQTATFCGQQGRISRTVRAILNGQPGISAGQRVLRPTDQY